MKKAYTIIASMLSLLIFLGCRESGTPNGKNASEHESVSTAASAFSDSTKTDADTADESTVDTFTETVSETAVAEAETTVAENTTEAVQETTGLPFEETTAQSPETTASVTERETTAAVDVTTTAVRPKPEPVTEDTTGPAEETTAPIHGTTEAVTEEVTAPAVEGATEHISQETTGDITAETSDDTTAETSPELTEAELEANYSELAMRIMKPTVDEVIAKINADRFAGSTVTYPFEPRLAREELSDTQKLLYDDLRAHAESVEAYSFTQGWRQSYSDLIIAANALYRDCPQLSFYSKLREVKEYSRVTAIELYYFLPYDEDAPAEENRAFLNHELRLMEAICDYIADSIPEDFSTYDKYRYIAAVVSYQVEYDYDYVGGHQSENAYGALVSGISICRGYAKAFEYLCERADLYCRFVQGANYAGEVHMWNLVKLESGTYHVDVTWSDTTYGEPLGSGWMRYFMVTQADTVKNHIIDDGTVATGTRLNKKV